MRTKILYPPKAYQQSLGSWGMGKIVGELRKMGVRVYTDQLGDPVARGICVPRWIREHVAHVALNNKQSYAYGQHTRGYRLLRENIASTRNLESGTSITPEDILFTNGVSDAIFLIFKCLASATRVVCPTLVYPVHLTAEQGRSHYSCATPRYTAYTTPDEFFDPDALRHLVRTNESIGGILIVNPDNPTGNVFTWDELCEIVDIAELYGLFIIADEIYANLVYSDTTFTPIADVFKDMPCMILRGISKEVPWPGARCGWIEFHNRNSDSEFDQLAENIVSMKRNEICATVQPQRAFYRIVNDPRYGDHLIKYRDKYERKAGFAVRGLSDIPGICVMEPSAAFYISVCVESSLLQKDPVMSVTDERIRNYLMEATKCMDYSHKLVALVLAETGMYTIPLSAFGTNSVHGFRMTVLEPNDCIFQSNISALERTLRRYSYTD